MNFSQVDVYEKKLLMTRLFNNSYLGPNGCWIYLMTTPRGYGIVTSRKTNIFAHRLSYFLFVDSNILNTKLLVCHKCDNPPCINPDHLFAGTFKDNMQDKCKKGRHFEQKVTHCPQGHEYTKENTAIYSGKRRCMICARASANKYHSSLRVKK